MGKTVFYGTDKVAGRLLPVLLNVKEGGNFGILGQMHALSALDEKPDKGFVVVNAVGANLVYGFPFADDVYENFRLMRFCITQHGMNDFCILERI